MRDQETVSRIQRIFEEVLSLPAPEPQMDIVEASLLDSLALVTLLFEIEQEFGVEIPLESLEIDDFRSVENIARFIARTEVAP
jgi:D-alanine--poly(phosphoribitol) ligase subunit 2